MSTLGYGLLSILILVTGYVTRPTHESCPPGWWLSTGVRRNGDFVCRIVPIGDTYRDKRGILRDPSIQPPGELTGHVYCEPNAIPTIVDTRGVACR